MSSMPPKDQLSQAIDRLDAAILETEHPGILEAIKILLQVLRQLVPGFGGPTDAELDAMSDTDLLAYANSLCASATAIFQEMTDGG